VTITVYWHAANAAQGTRKRVLSRDDRSCHSLPTLKIDKNCTYILNNINHIKLEGIFPKKCMHYVLKPCLLFSETPVLSSLKIMWHKSALIHTVC